MYSEKVDGQMNWKLEDIRILSIYMLDSHQMIDVKSEISHLIKEFKGIQTIIDWYLHDLMLYTAAT